jgi:phytase-like protein
VRRGLTFAAILAVAACKNTPSSVKASSGVALTEWTGDDVRGLSGLARRGDGRFFAVPERARAMIAFEVKDRGARRVGGPIPIVGAEQGLDLESLAWIEGDRFAIGTETLTPERTSDAILFGAIARGVLAISERIAFEYAPWALTARRNDGIEGLCSTAGKLIAASETVGTAGDHRFAPLGVYDLAAKVWTSHRLMLTSLEGKISSLACRTGSAGAIELYAVERHFETMRVLTATIGTSRDIRPEVACDLRPLFPNAPPNFEGIELSPDGGWVLVSDNDYRGVTGPAIVAVVAREACAKRAPAAR